MTNKRTRYLVIAVGIIALGGATFVAVNVHQQVTLDTEPGGAERYIVDLSEAGFMPPVLTIQPGETVTFTSSTGEEFWPASDSHPYHSIYSEFDAGRPIAPTDTWSFTFTKEGKWRYHDHLRLERGIIIVGDDVTPDCDSEGRPVQCWDEMILTAIENGGALAGFEKAQEIYQNDSAFGTYCHRALHNVGSALYEEFKNGKKVQWQKRFFDCTGGTIHGFMNTLFNKSRDFDAAISICNDIRDSFADDSSGTARLLYEQCFHGLGDSLFDLEQGRHDSWPDMINTVVGLCDGLAVDDAAKHGCVTGVFTAVAGFEYSEIISAGENPYAFCGEIADERYAPHCFWNLNGLIMRMSDRDLERALEFTEYITSTEHRRTAEDSLVFHATKTYQSSQREKIHALCTQIDVRRNEGACQNLFISGLMSTGIPGEEYAAGMNFCEATNLSASKQRQCIETLLRLAEDRYSAEKYQKVCSLVAARHSTAECL